MAIGTASAQDKKTVSGVVTDAATGQPLAGVIVEAYGNKRFTAMTDENGTYQLTVPDYVSSVSMRVDGYQLLQKAIGSNLENIDGQLYAEGWTMTLRVNAIGYATLEAQHDGVTEQKEGYLNSTSWLYLIQLNGRRDVFGMFSRFGFDTVSGTLRMVDMDQHHIEDDDLSMTRMVFCRRTDENGDAIPPEGLTEIPLSELDGHWLPTGGKWATKYPYIEMTFSSSADEVEWRLVNEQLSYDKIVPRWETREYLIDGDAIRLYRIGKEVQFFLHPKYDTGYYTATWGDMTLRYDRENHTIHIVQHDVDLYILEKEKTPEPTPAPYDETP
jgi:hypothetical protein